MGEIYIAEGSDWCWWFGDDHSSANDEEFDSLYRKHLMNVYEFLDLDIPAQLFVPILEEKVISPTLMPAGLINPIIDGGISNFMSGLQQDSMMLVKLVYNAQGRDHYQRNLLWI